MTRLLNRAGPQPGCGHIHPHQLRHTLATQAINRGMSLEAIAAMLGHKQPGHDPALRQDRQPDRRRRVLRRHREGRRPLRPAQPATRRRARPEHGPPTTRTPPHSSATATAPDPPSSTALRSRSARPAPSSRPASSSDPPCKPNTTTPQPRAKTTEPACSPACSPASATAKPHEPMTAITRIMPMSGRLTDPRAHAAPADTSRDVP